MKVYADQLKVGDDIVFDNRDLLWTLKRDWNMLISKINSRNAKWSMTVIDSFVGKGLEQGGHSALPDIDSDFASDRRQEIKEYLEERYNMNGKQHVFSAGTFSCLKLESGFEGCSTCI